MVELNFTLEAAHGDLSRALADTLKTSLFRQRVACGERMPSNREIAERAGVSQVTARMAVGRLCREGVLEARPGVGTFVAATPGELALPRQIGLSRIGVVLSPWDSREEAAWDSRQMFGDIIGALHSESRQLLIFTYGQWLEYADRCPEALITENALDTLVWFHNGPRETAFIVRLEQQKFRQLIFNRRQPGVRVPAILHDDNGVIDDIVGRLSDGELESLLLLLGNPEISPYCERLAAITAAFARRNRTFRPEQVIQLPEAPFPEWVTRMLPREIERARAEVVVDMVGCVNLWPRFASALSVPPKLISLCPMDRGNENPDFHYTYYQPTHSYVIPGMLRDFFAGRSVPEPLLLPFRRCEI